MNDLGLWDLTDYLAVVGAVLATLGFLAGVGWKLYLAHQVV